MDDGDREVFSEVAYGGVRRRMQAKQSRGLWRIRGSVECADRGFVGVMLFYRVPSAWRVERKQGRHRCIGEYEFERLQINILEIQWLILKLWCDFEEHELVGNASLFPNSPLQHQIDSPSPCFNSYLLKLRTMDPPIARRTAKTVCVMDVSSPLGGAIVNRLLQLGYSVHAASFSRGDSMTAAWRESRRVRVFAADPLDYHSIAAAIRGCSGLFYTCDNESSYDEFMVEREVRAAHNVLEACAQADSIERVVFTSSVTAVIWREKTKIAADVDERDWSDPIFCRKFKLWHALAKTLSEKTAWALAMDRGVDMVSVNAGLILAGAVLPSNPYLKGTPEMYEDGVLVTAKLEFLVDAHICVFESADAYGRYLCFNHTICRPQDAVDFARVLSPNTPNPPPSAGLRVIQERIHSKKLTKLMFEFGAGLQAAE